MFGFGLEKVFRAKDCGDEIMNIEYTQRERKELIIDITQECKCVRIAVGSRINTAGIGRGDDHHTARGQTATHRAKCDGRAFP